MQFQAKFMAQKGFSVLVFKLSSAYKFTSFLFQLIIAELISDKMEQ